MFYFPYTPAELAEQVDKVSDGPYILDMLIPLEPLGARERFARLYPGVNPPTVATEANEEHAGHLYTCRHWNEETRLCGAYESRPRMCQFFPYGDACVYGCDYLLPATRAKEWHGSRWSWKGWRWRRGAYHAPAHFAPAPDYKPGEGWLWDEAKRTLRPDSSGHVWDQRKRLWVDA